MLWTLPEADRLGSEAMKEIETTKGRNLRNGSMAGRRCEAGGGCTATLRGHCSRAGTMFMFQQMGRGGATSACASPKKFLTLSDGPACPSCENVWGPEGVDDSLRQGGTADWRKEASEAAEQQRTWTVINYYYTSTVTELLAAEPARCTRTAGGMAAPPCMVAADGEVERTFY